MDYKKIALQLREKHGGQIGTQLKSELKDQAALSTLYTPGIAGPCVEISKDKTLSKKLTIRKNTVAVISDGSAVLGLGNIGAEASLPVMEGKCMLLKHFGNVDAFPIVLDTQDTEEIIQTIKNIAPGLGGINLEDIAAPRCFEIEERLSKELDIPVFHDDQHGTAICTLAALINSLKIVQKNKNDIRIVIAGAGSAGIAIAKLLKDWGAQHIELIDSKGIVCCSNKNHASKQEFCSIKHGQLKDALVDADVFIGVAKPNLVTPEMVETMADDPVIFAMSNPDPEIHPDTAKNTKVKIMATGRSDFPNQINNVLVFPGVFRGLLDGGINQVTTKMKLRAAKALADLVKDPTPAFIIPKALDMSVAPAIAKAVQEEI